MQGLLRIIKRTFGKLIPVRSHLSSMLSTIQEEVMSYEKTVLDARAILAINPKDLHAQELIVSAQSKKFHHIKDRFDKEIFKGNAFYKKINFPRFNMYLDNLDKGSIYTLLCYIANLLEPFEISIFCELICRNPDSLVIDVGANYGLYTLYACDLARYNIVNRVIAVEPDRRVFNKLTKSIYENGFNLTAISINKAISDIDCQEVELYINSAGSVDNRTITDAGISNIIEHYPIETTTLDSIIIENEQNDQKIKNIIIKMDIQGREPIAFRGMLSTLTNYPSIAILFELDPSLIRSAGGDPFQFANEVFAAGFDKYINVDATAQLLRPFSSVEDFNQLIRHCESMGHNDPRRYTTILAYREMIGLKALQVTY